jgi:NADP-dependent 3-hydroxy acid dehydrogenase YdfG
VIAARTEADLDRTETQIKNVSPKTQVLKVVTDVSDEAQMENLFKEAFNRFPEIDVRLLCFKAYSRFL